MSPAPGGRVRRAVDARALATAALALAIVVAAWMLGQRDVSAPAGGPPALSARESCPTDAQPLSADAVRSSVRTARVEANGLVRADAPLDVAGAARGVLTQPAPGCTEQFGRRAVLVWLKERRADATWEFVVYRAPAGYRVWRAALCCGPGGGGPPPPPGPPPGPPPPGPPPPGPPPLP
jgi:hypothetical protein